MAQDTLTITDNRTGRTYEVPVAEGTIRAIDLRQIKVVRRRLRADDLRSGLHEHGGLPERDHLHRRRPGASCAIAATRSSSSPSGPASSRWPTCCARASCRPRPQLDKWTETIKYHTYVHTNITKFLEGFRYDAHPMGMLLGAVGALSTFYPDAKNIHDPANRYLQRVRLLAKTADHRGVRVPALARAAVRLPGQRSRLHRQLRQHDVQHRRAAQAQQGAAARARDPADPARRPRAELLHQRGARGRLVACGPVLGGLGRHRGALRPAPRRRQRGGAADAGRDRRQEEHPRVHRGGEGRRRPADGLRPPGLQVVRPAGQAHQEGGRRRVRSRPGSTPSSRSRWSWSGSRWRTSTSSSGSSTRTWTSTPA